MKENEEARLGVGIPVPAVGSVSTMDSENDAGYQIIIAIRRIIRAIEIHSKRLEREFGLTVPQLLILKEIGLWFAGLKGRQFEAGRPDHRRCGHEVAVGGQVA